MHRVSGAWKVAFLPDAIHMAREHRQNAIQYLYLHAHVLTTNFVAILITLTQKYHFSQISNVQKVRHVEQPAETEDELNKAAVWSSANNTNKRLISLNFFIIVNTATSYFFTNLHVFYFWNGHRERRSSHWHLQPHTLLAEQYRWCCADLHSSATMLSWMHWDLKHI